MLQKELNDLLIRVGPGTPGGEFMRRYWQPVGLSSELTSGGKPRQVRVLGEDLVLFRDDHGRPGLLGLHCSHRLTSLEYGRVEDGGIRCPFHGWVYDVDGRCLEQPAEPEGSSFKDRIRHPAYPCQELGGLIFAYMGPPDRKPLLPNYETLIRADGSRSCSFYPIDGNYLQHLEGALDTIHAAYLHTNNWSVKKHELAALPKPQIEFTETEYGVWQRGYKASPSPSGPKVALIFTYFFMPAGFIRTAETHKNEGDFKTFQSWYVPVDDGHTTRYIVAFSPPNDDGSLFHWPRDGQVMQPGADADYGRDYDRTDTISGISPTTPATFRAQDTMANETQGFPAVDRTLEHLGAHDPVVTAMRMVMLKGISDVEKGLDPKHVLRDPAMNEMVCIRGSEELERV